MGLVASHVGKNGKGKGKGAKTKGVKGGASVYEEALRRIAASVEQVEGEYELLDGHSFYAGRPVWRRRYTRAEQRAHEQAVAEQAIAQNKTTRGADAAVEPAAAALAPLYIYHFGRCADVDSTDDATAAGRHMRPRKQACAWAVGHEVGGRRVSMYVEDAAPSPDEVPSENGWAMYWLGGFHPHGGVGVRCDMSQRERQETSRVDSAVGAAAEDAGNSDADAAAAATATAGATATATVSKQHPSVRLGATPPPPPFRYQPSTVTYLVGMLRLQHPRPIPTADSADGVVYTVHRIHRQHGHGLPDGLHIDSATGEWAPSAVISPDPYIH
jgi:hypothetical protein